MDIAEAKLIMSTLSEVFEILAEEQGVEVGMPEGDALYDRVVIDNMLRRAKTSADFALMMQVA